jgi:hypothetical protein
MSIDGRTQVTMNHIQYSCPKSHALDTVALHCLLSPHFVMTQYSGLIMSQHIIVHCKKIFRTYLELLLLQLTKIKNQNGGTRMEQLICRGICVLYVWGHTYVICRDIHMQYIGTYICNI